MDHSMDPYDWPTDRVIAEVAGGDDMLAKSLRTNEVDGEVLLTVCTYERLKDDIGIIPLGKRSKVMRVIEGLRKRSRKYMNHIQDLASNTALPDDTGPVPGYLPALREIQSLEIQSFVTPSGSRKRKSRASSTPLTSPFHPSATPEPPRAETTLETTLETLLETPLQTPLKRRKPLSLLAATDECLPLFVPKSALHLSDHSAVRIVRHRKTGMVDTVPFSQEWSGSESSVNGMEVDMEMEVDHEPEQSPSLLADGGIQIENGGEGDTLMSIPGASLDEDQEEEEENVYGRDKNTIKDPIDTHDSRPTRLETARSGKELVPPNHDFGHSSKASASRKRRYLPVKGLIVDKIIYGETKVGSEILGEDDSGEFCIVSLDKFPGQRKYVERQLRHLFRGPESVTVVHKGHLRIGIKPYREDLVLKHYHQAITLFSAQANGSCTVSRENTTTVTLPWSTSRGTQTSSSDLQIVRFSHQASCPQPQLSIEDNSNHDWDYLMKWQNIAEDTQFPSYGDSGSDGEYSVDTWAAMEAERGPLERTITKTNREPLTVEQVRQLLTEGIKVIVEIWREKVMPRKEAQAWRIYHTARKRKERKKTARDAKVRTKELEERLEKMRSQIATVTWAHKGDVKKQLKILRPTVQDREEQMWLAGLMERKKTPERPEKAVGVIPGEEEGGEKLDVEDGDDEESLGSTSEEDYGMDEDEGMDGFIVPDTARDTVDGREVEVEGQKEIEEELARIAAEDELIDSDEGSGNDVPVRARRQRARGGGNKGVEEAEAEAEAEEDQPMVGMDGDDEDVSGTEEDIPLAPKLDKGKGKARAQSPTPVVKEEPRATQLRVIRGPTSGKDIPIIDLTIEDPPQNFNENILRPRKSLGDITHIDLLDDEEPDTPLMIVTRMVADTSQNKREAIWYRIEEFKPADLFSTVVIFCRQVHQKKVKNVAGLDEYEDPSNQEEASRLMSDSYNAEVYMPIAWYYCAWVLGKIDKKKRLSNDELKQVDDMKKFIKFRKALIEVLRPYVDAGPPELASEPENAEPLTPRNDKRGGISKGKTSREYDSEREESDDGTTEMTLTTSRHRKRPRKEVVEDATAKAKRELLDRKMRNMARRAKDENTRNKLAGVENGTGMIRINIGKYAKDNDIFFHPSLAERLKPHQVEGIRFMWQQLVQTGENRGALLAHTMGLGKTLQVIALLYTLATAACSDDKKTYGQIPEHLRVSKTLILSPPGLVENWSDEFDRWLPVKPDSDKKELDLENIGDIIRADGTIPPMERHRNITRWYNNGGVLLMGYQTFRTLVQIPLVTEEVEDWRYKQMLLEGPNIIVADEAHQLKNPTSKISEATRDFKSMSRIAMTGSPLSNNLLEYWSMIDWIDPLFLGPRKEFEQKYVQPINDGLYADSSIPERRKCLKMLTVLKNDIGPKVHRMDISVIQHDLPPKTEFLIKVPLTALQLEMYRRFLKDPTTTGRMGEIDVKGTSGNRFFDVIHLMSQICNHPLCFVQTLEMRETGKQELRVRPPKKPSSIQLLDDESEDLDDPDCIDIHLMEALLSETNQPYPWARAVMNTVRDEYSLEHSYKMLLVKSIIECSIKVGDQLLLFTHSALTLNFLGEHLKKWNYRYQKIDGKTAMNTRQTITKKFNAGEGGSVCLISTEAGGLGLNLPGANRIIIFDFKWSPMWEEQAVGRGFRLGQKKHVFVYRFHACGTYEEIMRNKVLFKNQLHSRVVDKRDPIRYATKQGKQYFTEPYDVPKEDLTEFRGRDPMVLDKIIEQTDFIRSIEYTNTFQRDDENDVLTAEEIRETEEMLKAEKDMRKAQGQQINDAARKADEDFRKLIPDASKLAEQAEFAKQVDLQIEQERIMSESTKLSDTVLVPSVPLAASIIKSPVPDTQARVMATAPPPLPLPRTVGRVKNVPVSKVVGKYRDAPPPSSAPPVGRPSTSVPKAKPNPKYGHPSSSQLVPPPLPLPLPLPPPPSPPSKNKFKLDISKGLPRIFTPRGKDDAERSNADKSGNYPDVDGGKGVASVGTLKLKG